MNIAVLVAKQAAGGRAARQAHRLGQLFQGHRVISVLGWGGEELGGKVLPQGPAEEGYLDSLHRAVDALCGEDADLYVLLGGDGLASYVAGRLLDRGVKQPCILGIAGGTANVGPVIVLTLEELRTHPIDSLSFVSCDALEAFDAGRSLALGFNDLVLGNTLISTMDGKALTIDAARLAVDGIKLPAAPAEAIAANLRVKKNDRSVPLGLAAPAQAVLSTISRDRSYGRGVMGALCFGAGLAHVAALALLSAPVVSFETGPAGLDAFLTASQLIFQEEDTLVLDGLYPETCLIADGNPFLLSKGRVSVRIRKDAVKVVCRCTHLERRMRP